MISRKLCGFAEGSTHVYPQPLFVGLKEFWETVIVVSWDCFWYFAYEEDLSFLCFLLGCVVDCGINTPVPLLCLLKAICSYSKFDWGGGWIAPEKDWKFV